MHDAYSDREALEVFVESVDELLASRFAQDVMRGVSVTLLANSTDGLSARCDGPEREATKAFLLTLRHFVQNNDPSSIGNTAQRVGTLNVEQQWKDEFRDQRDGLNVMLDGPLHVPVEGVGADTKRDVFEAFLYGIYAHATPRHRRTVNGWREQPYAADLEAQFYVILALFLPALKAMADVCRRILGTGAV